MSDGLYQVWYKLADYSGWELFSPEPCSFETAKAIARSLPVSKIVKLGVAPDDEENEPETAAARSYN